VSGASNPSAELCANDWLGGMLRVRFTWMGDRYGHAIELMEGYETRTLLKSVEGTERDEWPPSPPMQEVNVSRIASDSENRRVAMLVGAAGASHWSMCVAVCDQSSLPRESDGFTETELVFDVACRAQRIPRWLGSTYRVLAAPVAISEELNCACIPMAPPRCLIVTHSVALQMDTYSGLTPLLRFSAAENNFPTFISSTTIRWRYTLRFLGSTPRHFDQIILRPST